MKLNEVLAKAKNYNYSRYEVLDVNTDTVTFRKLTFTTCPTCRHTECEKTTIIRNLTELPNSEKLINYSLK